MTALPVCRILFARSFEEGRNHDIVEAVLLGPELVVAHVWISLDEKLLKRVVDLSGDHPDLDHGQNRRGDFFQDPADELLGRRATVEDVCVDR